jgi:hypothetical protein
VYRGTLLHLFLVRLSALVESAVHRMIARSAHGARSTFSPSAVQTATRLGPFGLELFIWHPGAQSFGKIGRVKSKLFHTILNFWNIHEYLPK